jgi:beta-lactamase class A
MRLSKRAALGLFGAALLARCAAPAVARDDDAKGQLLADLRRIEEGTAGRLGVSALRVKTGERVQFNANARYPMASTFKVPVAMLLLDQVDRGAVSLSQKVEVVAIYLSGSPVPVAQQEHAIAMASLALYRYATR